MRRMVLPILAMVLMACSGETEPPEESPEPTPEVTAPALPELAEDDSPAGAEAFARHYIEVLNYSALTGDTALLEELSADDCSGCIKYIELYKSTYENGGYFKNSDWSVEDTEVWQLAGGYDVALDISTREGTSRASDVDEVTIDPPFEENIILFVSLGDETYRVATFDRVAK